MPNYVDNTLEMKGPEKEIKEIQEKFKKENFKAFFPIPKELENTMEKNKKKTTKYKDWHDFTIKVWGTKTTYPELIYIEANELLFTTAWSPAIQFTINLSKLYPKIKFTHTYREESEPEIHTVKIQNGKILEEYSTAFINQEDIDFVNDTEEEIEEFFKRIKQLIIENKGRAILNDKKFSCTKDALNYLETIKKETLDLSKN